MGKEEQKFSIFVNHLEEESNHSCGVHKFKVKCNSSGINIYSNITGYGIINIMYLIWNYRKSEEVQRNKNLPLCICVVWIICRSIYSYVYIIHTCNAALISLS